MNTRRNVVIAVSMVLLMTGVGMGVSAPTEAADKKRSAMMSYRHLFMETKGKHAKAIKLLIKSKLSLRHIITHAEALAAMADDMLLLFPAGTTGGKSRAMDNIWGKDGKVTSDFIAKTIDMRKEAEAFVKVAKEGNYKKIKKQMGRFANKGCRSCHTDFRGEDFEGK